MDIVHLLEAGMLVCFGISWPFNIYKSWTARTARGKSLVFGFCVITGYSFGLASKFISGDITYVVGFYILDVVMVAIDLALTLRNHRLDKLADAAKAKCDCCGQ